MVSKSKGNDIIYKILEAHIQIKIHLHTNISNNKCIIIYNHEFRN
jgi:hypothetical protein